MASSPYQLPKTTGGVPTGLTMVSDPLASSPDEGIAPQVWASSPSEGYPPSVINSSPTEGIAPTSGWGTTPSTFQSGYASTPTATGLYAPWLMNSGYVTPAQSTPVQAQAMRARLQQQALMRALGGM